MSEEKKVGYVFNFIMDYGNGRQVQITGNFPVEASLEHINAELDKMRMATDRQKALVILREKEATLTAESKMVLSLEVTIAAYEKEVEKQLADMATGTSTVNKQNMTNVRAQFANYKQQKTEELQRHKTNAEIAEVTIASIKKEYGV